MLAPILSRVYQFSLNNGEVPSECRELPLFHFLRKGKNNSHLITKIVSEYDQEIPQSQTAVSLISVTCKVLYRQILASSSQIVHKTEPPVLRLATRT